MATGAERAGHKYSRRTMKNGKWVYEYADKPGEGKGFVRQSPVSADHWEVSHPSMYESRHVLGREIAHNIHDSLNKKKEREPAGMRKLRAREASPGSSLPEGIKRGGMKSMSAMRELLVKSSALIDPKPNPKGYDGQKAKGNKAPRKKVGKVHSPGTGIRSAMPNASPMGNPDPGLTHCSVCGAVLPKRGKSGKGAYGPAAGKGGTVNRGGTVSHLKSLMPHTHALLK